MKDAGTVVRKAFYDALNNALLVPGSLTSKVPVVDEKLDLNISQSDLFTVIGEQTENRERQQIKGYNASETDISITTVNRRKSTNSKVDVENVSDQMLMIIYPSTTGFGITLGSGFRLSYVKTLGSEYTFNRTDDGWEIMKKTTFRTRITQN